MLQLSYQYSTMNTFLLFLTIICLRNSMLDGSFTL